MPRSAITDPPIAIVGAGFSGTLLAVNLLRLGARVVLVERDHVHLARGLAYGTRRPEHLLNVRAANMSAFPEDAGHFLRWMGFDTADQANRFVPRLAYGRYLRELLLRALADAPDRIAVKQQEAVSVDWSGRAPVLVLDSGERVTARAVVLALGNLPPAPPAPFPALEPRLFYPDPWLRGACDNLDGVDHVLLLGSGLTAIDVALSLDAQGYSGRITALSRRGLRPHAHPQAGPSVGTVARPRARGSWLLRHMRERARLVGWREAVDELRPHTQSLWRLHDIAAQARFLRHLRPWWDIHRHRLAPGVATRIAALEAEGRLAFVAGKVTSATGTATMGEIAYRPRGGTAEERLRVDRIIGCTGPAGDLAEAPDLLLQNLLAQGRIRADVHRLGLDVDHLGRAHDAGGQPGEALFAVGPITRGEAWEIVAVPDIRRQVWELARLLVPPTGRGESQPLAC